MFKKVQNYVTNLPLSIIGRPLTQIKQQTKSPRKPIFSTSPIKDMAVSRTSQRNSMIISKHEGDNAQQPHQQTLLQALPPKQGTEKTQKNEYSLNLNSLQKRSSKNWTQLLQNSYQEGQASNKQLIKKSSQKYSQIMQKIERQSRDEPRKLPQIKQQRQLIQFSLTLDSHLQEAKMQNQMLKAQQYLLKQILQSNKSKIKNFEQLQNLESLNYNYKYRISSARDCVQSWKKQYPQNTVIFEQLMSILTF